VSSWKELREFASQFADIGAVLYGVAADAPDELRKLVDEHALPFKMLSDPQLVSGAELQLPMATPKTYYSARMWHAEIRRYPKPSFLQPALLVWKRTVLVYEWRQTETLMNLFGARGRPTGSDVLDIVRRSVA